MLLGMKTAYLLIIACLASFHVLPAIAAEVHPSPAKLSLQEKHDIRRIELYLNALKSVSANFLQISDNGNMKHGTIAIQRPGKMRVTYDKPSDDFIVADGNFLHMWDGEMEQQTSIPISEGIASIILREHVELTNKDLIVTRFVRYPAKLEIDLTSRENSEEGELTLIFEDKPLKLRQWRVLDPQGNITGINLENASEGVSFTDDTFIFVSPKLGKAASRH